MSRSGTGSPRDAIQPLEPRRLLSASIANHLLLIDGTPRSDTIVLTRGKRAVQVNVNGEKSQFSLKSFSTIRIRAGKGNDIVTIGTSDNAIAAAANVSAGAGDDRIICGGGNDTVNGEEGDDGISTATGDDVVHGGVGHDTVYGGDGNDQLFGDGQADWIFGNLGDDVLRGGRGDDELHDGLGKDAVFGEGDTDHFCVSENRKEFRDRVEGETMTTDHNGDLEVRAQSASTADGSSVTVRYTVFGDANLDGNVDFNDLVKLAQNYNQTVSNTTDSWWTRGDFTYDGKVDFNDLVKLAQSYNTALPTEPIPGAPADFEDDLAKAFASVGSPS